MKIILRNWEMKDAQNLAQIINNKKIQDYLRDGLAYPYTVHDAENYIEQIRGDDPQKAVALAICVEDRVVGNISVTRGENIHARTAELGYYLAEPDWGKGIATNAVKQLCSYIFKHTDILRIFAQPFSENIASCRVLEKAGFCLEGTLRKNAFKNGKVWDMKLYALVKDEPEIPN